jgi:hypothetical protein
MKVFKDKNCEDKELFSDSYKIELIDGVIYEIEGETSSEKFDSSKVNTGANASAEEPGEDVGDDQAVVAPNFVTASRLRKLEPRYSKKEFLQYLKAYLKSLEFPADQKADLQSKIETYMKNKVLKDFKNFDQYVGEEVYINLEDTKLPMICLLNYREDTDKPYMVAFKHGLIEEKY